MALAPVLNRTTDSAAERAGQLVAHQSSAAGRQTDRLFAWLFVFQWLGCIAAAIWMPPSAGPLATIAQPLWWVSVVGATISLVPLLAMWRWPGSRQNRYLIAVAQMLWAGLMLRLTEGQIGELFPVFGSIAILACYRDWGVLVTAASLVLLRDLARGDLWAVNEATRLHAWEQLAFVLLEVASLILIIRLTAAQQWMSALDRARLEESNRRLDADFRERTAAFRNYTLGLERARDELHQQAEALRQARSAAESANLAKSNLIATVSHEIRTPMTAILGYADVLIGNLQDAELLKAARTIQRNGEFLLQLVDDILDLSRIESGRLSVECIPCSPRQIVSEAVQLMKVRSDAKQLPLVVAIADDAPGTINSDPLRLRQILLNLVSNAIKFSSQGEVRIEVGKDEKGAGLRLIVADQGIGLTPRQIESLFQPFSQGDDTVSRLYGGSGMGLWISRRLANMLGGEISVCSAPGVGSRFTVTVATAAPQADAAKTPPSIVESASDHTDNLKGRHVLVADDSPDNQSLVEFVLTRYGAQVTVVDNGEDAVRAALDANRAGNPFDLILMDVQMPRVDGFAATEQLRSCGYAGPIVALTAHARPEELQQCRVSGCDACLSKPIDASLVGLIARLTAHRQAAPTTA